ncbi:hypothetical protein D4764_22G0001770 [Takifugu flavidus]|uniref:Uncharacterized protein n=1 Tax=Takifugu flavidus TaxID=433684 RepID=A0A5C6NEW4_9TELE|nr:hypothetical protein D4764_22G0001770 [Takifugu flavidus]
MLQQLGSCSAAKSSCRISFHALWRHRYPPRALWGNTSIWWVRPQQPSYPPCGSVPRAMMLFESADMLQQVLQKASQVMAEIRETHLW